MVALDLADGADLFATLFEKHVIANRDGEVVLHDRLTLLSRV
jgi:hypothetical protein